MLGKLLKHEFKAVSKVMLLINACTLLLSVVGCLTFASPLWEIDNNYIPFLAISSVMVYYIAVIAICISSIIYLMMRFYKNMYTDEGYLMHTLPVTPRQLILSKGITAFCWTSITSIMIGLSVIAIMISACLKFMTASELRMMIDELPGMFYEMYGMGTSQFTIVMVLSVIIGSISSILMIYAAISMGQLFSKHKVLSAVGCYVMFYFIMQILTMIIMAPYYVKIMSYNFDGPVSGYFNYSWIATLVLSLVSGIVYYIITEYIMTKKLNLE